MKKALKNRIRKKLNAEEADLSQNVDQSKREYRSLISTECAELGDRAIIGKSLDELGSVIAHYEKRLARAQSAQKRLENGHYGRCMECGEPIGEQRLLARPDTLFCYPCARKRERLKKYRMRVVA